MPSWVNIGTKNFKNTDMSFRQFKSELNRRLGYMLRNISVGQVTFGLNNLTGTLNLSKGGTGASLTAPTSDQLLFYDYSDSSVEWLELGSNLSISGNTLNVTIEGMRLTGQTIGGTVSVGDCVYNNSGTWETATTQFPEGIYEGSNVVVLGGIVTLTGLTANSIYYQQASGSVGTSSNDNIVGIAISTTQLVVNIRKNLLETTNTFVEEQTFSNNVILNQSPTVSTHAVRKDYVDGLIQNVKRKDNCVVATTGNITLSGEQTIDGVVTSSSRVLVWKQTTQTENGIYVSASGAWTRATDADTGAELLGSLVLILQGTTYSGYQFNNSNSSEPTIGVDNISFVNMGNSVLHNNTLQLQGGTTDQYYHLTSQQNTDVGSISSAQWGYLGSMDQGVATTDDVKFDQITCSDMVKFKSVGAFTTTSKGVSFYVNNDFYKIGFDDKGGSVGYIRYNVDLADSVHGHMFSAGTPGSETDLVLFQGNGDVYIYGTIKPTGYKSSDGSSGVSGSFTTADSKTVTVKDGLITSIV